ncbi:MAG: hypothetical protein JNM70_00705 [Anaerolineae bacterium]|nr:hypothetical protein [Anaerolineae bacterium]
MSRKLVSAFAGVLFLMLLFVFPLTATGQSTVCDPNTDYLKEADQLMQAEDFTAALAAYQCAIQIKPDEFIAYQSGVEAALRAGDFMAMAEINFLMLHRFGGKAFENVLTHYDQVLKANPDDAWANVYSAYYLMQAGMFRQALTNVDHAIALGLDNASVRIIRWGVNYWMQKPDDAAADYEKAAAFDPKNPGIVFNMAMSSFFGQELTNANSYLDETAQLGATSPLVTLFMGDVDAAAGDAALAAQHYLDYMALVAPTVVPAGTLVLNERLTVPVHPGETYHFSVDLKVGEVWKVNTSVGFKAPWMDPVLVLLAPDGTPLIGNNDDLPGEPAGNAALTYTPEVTGTYTLVMTTYAGIGEGTVKLVAELPK